MPCIIIIHDFFITNLQKTIMNHFMINILYKVTFKSRGLLLTPMAYLILFLLFYLHTIYLESHLYYRMLSLTKENLFNNVV